MKGAGLLLLFFCFAFGGARAAAAEKRKLDSGEGMILLIRSLKQRAAYYHDPPGAILQSFEHPVLARISFLDIMKREGLEEAIMRCNKAFCFSQYTVTALTVFAAGLGKAPLEEHLASCDYVLSLLEEECGRAREAYPKKQKLYLTLGVTLGLFAVILLV